MRAGCVCAAAIAAVILSACYEPAFDACKITCDPAAMNACPSGLACVDGLCGPPSGCTTSSPARRTLAAGAEHVCAVVDDGARMVCWGGNGRGQLAQPATMLDSDPRLIDLPVGVTGRWQAVTAGRYHTCGMFQPDGDGPPTIYCWGDGSRGQLGGLATSSPVLFTPPAPAAGSSWVTLGAGDHHTCAVAEDLTTRVQQIRCWGADDAGQLGDGRTVDQPSPQLVVVPDGLRWHSIDGGARHTCAVSSRAQLYCWGADDRGQLGTSAVGSAPAAIEGGLYTEVSAAADHTCAISLDEHLQCWGDNTNDRLGFVSDDVVPAPVPVSELGGQASWTAIETGELVTCGIQAGVTLCWGDGHPQTGLGRLTTGQLAPTTSVAGLEAATATELAVTAISACALTGPRAISCWGDNLHGELGAGGRTIARLPVEIPPPVPGDAWTKVVAGVAHTCAVRDAAGTREVYCWGRNLAGEVPGPTDHADVPLSVVPSETREVDVAVGRAHTCVVAEDTTDPVRCWGDAGSGQNPGGSPGGMFPIAAGANPRITADGEFTCVTGDALQRPWCWGTPAAGVAIVSPTALPGIEPFATTSVGWSHESGCALRQADNAMVCFGFESADGELGNGADGGGAVWTDETAAIAGLLRLGHGTGRTRCAADGSNGIQCWGDNRSGQAVPARTDTSLAEPTDSGLAANGVIVDLATGGGHTCVINNGGLQCWGAFADGQRTATATTRAMSEVADPAPVGPPFTVFRAVSAGAAHTCAIDVDDRLYCWGRNTYGQLGTGVSARATAEPVDLD